MGRLITDGMTPKGLYGFNFSFLCFSSYYVPLIVIGRKALRLTGNSETVILSRKMLLTRLNDWFQSVSSFDPFPEQDELYLTMCNMPFLYPIYHFIRLQLLKNAFLDALSMNVNDDPIIESVLEGANAISKSIKAFLLHNPHLLHLTLLMKYCVLFAGAFHCSHIVTMPNSEGLNSKMAIIRDHINFLEIFGQIHPQCLLDAKTLLDWMTSPQDAVDFLREKNF